MRSAPVESSDLPPCRHRGPCPRCGGRGPIRVHFDRDCRGGARRSLPPALSLRPRLDRAL